jgi:hypothetical protein
LKQLTADIGRSPTVADLKANSGYPPLRQFTETFGSWNAAKEAADLETYRKEGNREPYSDTQLLQILREIDSKISGPVTLRKMNDLPDSPSAVTYERRFGSWNKAKKAAGLETIEQDETSVKYSDEELLEMLRSLAKELERTVTIRDVEVADDLPNITTFERRFGSWNKAKEAAGLKTIGKGGGGRSPGYSDEELLNLLRHRASEVDGVVTKDDMDDSDGYPGSTTYARRFGSWSNAKKRAGLQAENQP